MNVTFRTARPDDVAVIASWTQDTFEWGDYVGDALTGWIEDPSGAVMVAEVGNRPVAVARVAMVSPTEAWAQGARVHPDHRRLGIATELSGRLWDWARHRGAQVVRLAVEDDNATADAHVTSMGFRRIADWRSANRELGSGPPVPEGNGGRRLTAAERLRPAPSAEAEPAFVSWSSGDLGAAAHGLFPVDWVWRLMTLDHLVLAARSRSLWEGPPGWAMLETTDDVVRVHWLETGESEARTMVRALVDYGTRQKARRVRIMAPRMPWFDDALTAQGFDLYHLGVYALAL